MTRIDPWNWNDDYSRAFAATDDPRLLAVIERLNDPEPPDGDAFAPAAFVAYRHGWDFDPVKTTFTDPEAFRACELARNFYGSGDPRIERYLRAFHGIREIRTISSSTYQGGDVLVILDTPAFRKHVGTPDDYEGSIIDGDVEAWQAYLDGDVYGVGYAVNESRVIDDGEPVALDDGSWDVDIQSWGFYGEKYAKETALRFDYGRPDLPQMLSIEGE